MWYAGIGKSDCPHYSVQREGSQLFIIMWNYFNLLKVISLGKKLCGFFDPLLYDQKVPLHRLVWDRKQWVAGWAGKSDKSMQEC